MPHGTTTISAARDLTARGFAALRAGKIIEADELSQAALKADPNDAAAHSLRGQWLQLSGQFEDAQRMLTKAVEISPNDVGNRLTLAEFFASQKKINEAIREVRAAVAVAPNYARAWEKLGDFTGAVNQLPDAFVAFQRAAAIEPNDIIIAMKAASAASCMGKFSDARAILHNASQLANVNDAFLALYVDVLEALRDWRALAEVSQAWSEQQPTHPRAWEARAKAEWETGRLRQAIEYYRKALTLTAPDANRLLTFAQLCLNALEYDEAEKALNAAETLDPRNAGVLSTKAGLLTVHGQFAEAESYCRRSLALDANDVLSYRLLGQLKRGKLTGVEQAALSRLSEDKNLRVEYRISANFTLADAYDAEGNVNRAMAAYNAAHQLALERGRLEGFVYDPQQRTREIDFLIEHFAAIPTSTTSPSAPQPIFIVGMPRSGTTLIESVLGAHSQVFACGERNAMRQIMQIHFGKPTSIDTGAPDTSIASVNLAKFYFEGLPDIGAAEYVTDKNPWNFDAIGLILTLFPNARIIHVHRDPLEVGLSIYRNEFSKFQPFAQRLEHIGHYYGEYARLMDHWKRISSDRLINIRYEIFATDFERSAQSLIESCGLEWEEDCRNFQANRRIIATLSMVQAREPVTDRSGRAKRYAKHLGPLIGALRDAGVAFDEE